jgi:hypothetical protein
MHSDVVEEIRTLTQDIALLRNAYSDNYGNRASVLRMTAAKCDYVASVFREMAEAIEPDITASDADSHAEDS